MEKRLDKLAEDKPHENRVVVKIDSTHDKKKKSSARRSEKRRNSFEMIQNSA